MAVYTTQVRTILESLTGNELATYKSSSEIISEARPLIFDFGYPIYDTAYKPVLETKILRHYFTREIGEETVGLWKFRLETRLNEIMPYYNKLYESEAIKYNPLTDYAYTKEHTGEGDEVTSQTEGTKGNRTTSSDTTETTSGTSQLSGSDTTDYTSTGADNRIVTHDNNITEHSKTLDDVHDDNTTERAFSDTPQGQISNVSNLAYLTDYTETRFTDKKLGDIETNGTTGDTGTGSDDLNYNRTDKTILEHGRKDTTSGSKTGESTGTETSASDTTRSGRADTTAHYVETISGKLGAKLYPEMIQAYRDALINIDMDIIQDLSDLFMLIY